MYRHLKISYSMLTTNKKALSLLIATILTLSLLTYAAVLAEDTPCTGTLDPGTYENVVVPAGETCVLTGDVTVEGNVIVEAGGSLIAGSEFGGPSIGGNIQAQGAASLTLTMSTVGGSIQVTASTTATAISLSTAGGDVEIVESTGSIAVDSSEIGGNLKLQANTAETSATVSGNTVGGNLQCFENTPDPVGTSNTVSGNKEGQCTEDAGF